MEATGGIFRRLLLGALLVVVASASASAVATFREVDNVVDALRSSPALQLGGELAEADAGKPQTLMLIGSDKRAATARDAGGGARSDTVILVRLDPSKKATALMSLPRDLKVRIPGHGTDKLNAAYSIGGTRLTLRTVKQLTGLRINHVINIDFTGFREAVNAIGCVYVDIDRRYYNDNSSGEQYATIDVKPGYQRLCGQNALDYVRYRHTDTDIVRSARQQDFLGQAKQQVAVGALFSDRDTLVDIFGRYTRTDAKLRSRRAVLRLVKLVVASARHPIREVHFEGQIGASYVTASDIKVKKLAKQFLGVEATKGPRGRTRRKRRPRVSGDLGLEQAPAAGRQQALQAITGGARLAVFYPQLRTRGSLFVDQPRVYAIRAPDDRVYASYRMVIRANGIGEYYGLQGTRWMDPPILKHPSERRRMRGRRYELFYDGDRLRLVAWRTREAVYWVSNTLLQTLSERQMLAIARSARTL